MRLVLRNYEQLSYRFKKNDYTRNQNKNQGGSDANTRNAKSYKGTRRYTQEQPYYYTMKQMQRYQKLADQKLSPREVNLKSQEIHILNSPKPGSFKLEGNWYFVANSIMMRDYHYLKPKDQKDTAHNLIKRYQDNLKLNMENHLMPKLYEDDKFIKKMAKYHASEMGPLTASFLRQGYNFLDKKLIIHLLIQQNIKTIKQLMLGGAFQTAECIDDEVVVHILARFELSQRNHFLINLLPYHVELLRGQIVIDEVKNFDEQVIEEVNQRQFLNALYLSNSSNCINKLRLLWGFQRRYLSKFNLMQFMVPQLKKVTFLSKNPEEQILINKQIVHVMNTLFESQIFESIFFKMLQKTQTFPNFIKAWSFTYLLLSKLRSIPVMLDRNNCKQLHSTFQLIQMNLPKHIANQFMRNTVFQILIHEEHHTISMHNYYQCLKHWDKDYVQPPTTLYNTPLTSILNQNNPTLTISYRQNDKANQFAITNLILNRKNVEEKPAIITQSQVIHNLLKGNYQSVFDDFLVRYSLPSDFDAATKFQMKLKEADKNLSFVSKDQEALYKLKLAYNFFFIESLPKPLKKQDLQAYKMNLGVASLLDTALFEGKQLLGVQEQKQVEEYRAKIEEFYEQNLFKQFLPPQQIQKQKQDNQHQLSISINYSGTKGTIKKQDQSQSQDFVYKKTQDYINMLKTDKDHKIDKQILYLNDEMAIMLKELLDEKLINQNYFHEVRKLPRLQRIEEINKLVKKYNEYYIGKLNEQTKQIQLQKYKQDQQLKRMGIDTYEKRKDYQAQKFKQTKDQLKQQIFALQSELSQLQQEWNLLQEQIEQQIVNFQQDQNQIIQKIESGRWAKQQNQQSSFSMSEDEQLQKAIQSFAKGSSSKNLKQFQSQIFQDNDDNQFIDNQYANIVSTVIEAEEETQSTQIDGARDDRAIYFAKVLSQVYTLDRHLQIQKTNFKEEIEPIEIKKQTQINLQAAREQGQLQAQGSLEQAQQEGIFASQQNFQNAQIQAEKASKRYAEQQKKAQQEQQLHILQAGLIKFLRPITYFQQNISMDLMIKMNTDAMINANDKINSKKKRNESQQDLSEDHKNNQRGWKKQTNHLFSKQNKFKKSAPLEETEKTKKREVGFFKKIKSGFSTVSSSSANQDNKDLLINKLFDLQNIPKYRSQEVSKQFFNLMQIESHIPRVGDGNIVAKYLFLQGRREGAKTRVDPKKIMTIQFSTVVGSRSKSYQKYIKNTLYTYSLDDNFYKNLLEDQLKLYNRNEFKMIVAHIIHYKDTISDQLIELICQISEKHLIGYSLVEIAQFIKANSIKLSAEALERVAKTWQKFDIINEDLLPFIKEYCAKVDIPFKTQFYSHFCRSLIITKKFEKLRALCDLVFAEIRPKPLKISSTLSASEVEALQRSWKQKQNEQFVKLYLQLLEVITMNLDTKQVPEFISKLYEDYIKLKTTLSQRELAYGMICFSLKKEKFYQLLVYLQKHPELGTSFMYDCTLKALLSNFEELQEFSERIIESSVIKNRIVLQNQQILRTIQIFKRAATSNAFSKFLEHSLRFQVDMDKQQDIKKQMFYVLNHNVEQVSVAGIFNLLDFIFNEKKEKERVDYRALMLAEEQKERKLHQIQKQNLSNTELGERNIQKEKGKVEQKVQKNKDDSVQLETSDASSTQNSAKNNPSKKKAQKAEKKLKKQKIQKKLSQNQLVDQILGDQSAGQEGMKSTSLMNDDDIVMTIKNQTKKNESYKRKGVASFGKIYESIIQGLEAEEEALKDKEQKARMGAKDEKSNKKPAKSKK